LEEWNMDLKQLVLQRTRECFAERFGEIVSQVRQDREALRGWEEPAHLRAALRRTVRQEAGETQATETALAEPESLRTAGEPQPGEQREALGRTLEAGAAALDKVARSQTPGLTPEELVGLECILLLYARPSLLVCNGSLAAIPPFWKVLEQEREAIEIAQRGVGRIELLNHPEYDWAGTGFLVSDRCLLTTRRTAELFIENAGGEWQFRPNITAWLDNRSHECHPPSASCRIRAVLGVHEHYDLALLEVESPQENGGAVPLVVAAQAPPQLEGRSVYMVGYPVCDSRRSDPPLLARIFREAYNLKRVQPGMLRGEFQFRDVQLLHYDCATLGHLAGACLMDMETHQVLGLYLAGRYLEMGTAVPLWALRDDPLLRRAGVTFAEATSRDVAALTVKLEHLARSRHWAEARNVVAGIYQRAFGDK
jgi:hypothetical protein